MYLNPEPSEVMQFRELRVSHLNPSSLEPPVARLCARRIMHCIFYKLVCIAYAVNRRVYMGI